MRSPETAAAAVKSAAFRTTVTGYGAYYGGEGPLSVVFLLLWRCCCCCCAVLLLASSSLSPPRPAPSFASHSSEGAPSTPPQPSPPPASQSPAGSTPWTPAAGDRVALNTTIATTVGGSAGATLQPGAPGTVLCRLSPTLAIVCFDGLSTGLDLASRCPAGAPVAASGCQAGGTWAVYASDLAQAPPPACDPARAGALGGARVALAGAAVGGTSLNVTIPTGAAGTVRLVSQFDDCQENNIRLLLPSSSSPYRRPPLMSPLAIM